MADAGPAAPLTAADVRAALRRHWPETAYLHIEEAPLDASRMGTKCDVLVVALWRSKRYELDAVEVKVSVADWRNEIRTVHWEVAIPGNVRPARFDTAVAAEAYVTRFASRDGIVPRRVVTDTTAKSDEWRERAHRFWIACPWPIANRIQTELPEGWGLLAVRDDGVVVTVVKAVKRKDPTPLSWPQTIGLMRSAADAGAAAIVRAESRGQRHGWEQSKAERERLHRVAAAAARQAHTHGIPAAPCSDVGCRHNGHLWRHPGQCPVDDDVDCPSWQAPCERGGAPHDWDDETKECRGCGHPLR